MYSDYKYKEKDILGGRRLKNGNHIPHDTMNRPNYLFPRNADHTRKSKKMSTRESNKSIGTARKLKGFYYNSNEPNLNVHLNLNVMYKITAVRQGCIKF